MKLCPYWSRFFQLENGEWIAFCSKAECDRLDQERPGWREYSEVEYSSECQLGFGETIATLYPSIVQSGWPALTALDPQFAHLLARHDLFHRKALTDDQWSRVIDLFIEYLGAKQL